jgi:hypothetical protein
LTRRWSGACSYLIAKQSVAAGQIFDHADRVVPAAAG